MSIVSFEMGFFMKLKNEDIQRGEELATQKSFDVTHEENTHTHTV
jgi:hypothetical protein